VENFFLLNEKSITNILLAGICFSVAFVVLWTLKEILRAWIWLWIWKEPLKNLFEYLKKE